mmetsp:Transcript_42855/g.135100  ORF Transcript_42855/g.135100 Transcript_42855/m.135100 type:complete len:201 (+) Transcript_42855:711-1313(+)
MLLQYNLPTTRFRFDLNHESIAVKTNFCHEQEEEIPKNNLLHLQEIQEVTRTSKFRIVTPEAVDCCTKRDIQHPPIMSPRGVYDSLPQNEPRHPPFLVFNACGVGGLTGFVCSLQPGGRSCGPHGGRDHDPAGPRRHAGLLVSGCRLDRFPQHLHRVPHQRGRHSGSASSGSCQLACEDADVAPPVHGCRGVYNVRRRGE